jgi:hypothetical protein
MACGAFDDRCQKTEVIWHRTETRRQTAEGKGQRAESAGRGKRSSLFTVDMFCLALVIFVFFEANRIIIKEIIPTITDIIYLNNIEHLQLNNGSKRCPG